MEHHGTVLCRGFVVPPLQQKPTARLPQVGTISVLWLPAAIPNPQYPIPNFQYSISSP